MPRCQPNQALAYNPPHLKIRRTVHRFVPGSVCFTSHFSSRVLHTSGSHMARHRVSSYPDALLCQQSSALGSVAGSHSRPEKTRNYWPLHRIVSELQKHVLLSPNYSQCFLSWMPKIPTVALTPPPPPPGEGTYDRVEVDVERDSGVKQL